MDALDKAKSLLATEFSNVFILIEDAEGNLLWGGSNLFGEGACRRFIREITRNEVEYEIDPEDEGDL